MSIETTRNTTRRRERNVDDAIRIIWSVIDEAKMHLEDEMTTPEEKRRWAKNLCDSIGVLNKLLACKGETAVDDENLGSLLVKVPRTLRRDISRGVQKWRKTSFSSA